MHYAPFPSPSFLPLDVYTYVGAIKGKHVLGEREKHPLFTIYNPRCWLPLADYRAVSVVHGLQWHQRRALECIVENLIRFRKTLFDHSKRNSCISLNSRMLEHKSSRNVKLAKSLWRAAQRKLPIFRHNKFFFPFATHSSFFEFVSRTKPSWRVSPALQTLSTCSYTNVGKQWTGHIVTRARSSDRFACRNRRCEIEMTLLNVLSHHIAYGIAR